MTSSDEAEWNAEVIRAIKRSLVLLVWLLMVFMCVRVLCVSIRKGLNV